MELKRWNTQLEAENNYLFNWTNVELKRWNNQLEAENNYLFNWTNLELKPELHISVKIIYRYLIEPMWNWNRRFPPELHLKSRYLIEPMWNWNEMEGKIRFNSTLVQLNSNAISDAYHSLSSFQFHICSIKYRCYRAKLTR